MTHLRLSVFVVFFLISRLGFAEGEIRKVTAPPSAAGKAVCTIQDIAAGKCTAANGSTGGARSLGVPIGVDEIAEHNARSEKVVKKNAAFMAETHDPKLKAAVKAAVQILPKCAIGIKGNRYEINGVGPSNSEFCTGHPLAGSRLPSEPEGLKTLAGDRGKAKVCEVNACSGGLVGGQDTIVTAAHCLKGKSPKDFCNDFVFVFNRTEGKTDFSKDEVAECDSGTSVDTNASIADFNTNADVNTKDHAVLKLKQPVPVDVAQALSMRTTALNSAEELYAVGHPRGTTRAISKLSSPTSPSASSENYSYVHMEGYAQPGNSGGPLLDRRGQVVGFMAAVDDTRHGGAEQRDPLYLVEGSPKVCRSQAAPGPYKVEAIGYASELVNSVRETMASGGPTIRDEVDEVRR